MTVAYDADAARAARAEAAGEPFQFTFGGALWSLPTPKEWPIEVTGSLAQGDLPAAMRELMGADIYAEFAKHKPTLADVEGIFGAVAKWQGIRLGE